VQFDKLYQKLYNRELWLMAYESIAAKQGNMTAGVDGETIDGAGWALIETMIAELKMSSYKPSPVRREYIEKGQGKRRPLGIPSFRDKLLQTVIRLILEAIYEPLFSENSHGFRPNRSCHTALQQVKKMQGIRWWVEGDIKDCFGSLNHKTLVNILSQRITDKRFLHLIQQLLQAGYIEDWQYHKTYSGVPQGGNLSPLLSNIYLNELDNWMASKIADFNKGKKRKATSEYRHIRRLKQKAKRHGQKTGDWSAYKARADELMRTTYADPQDPSFRRMVYSRYADDFLVGIIGSKEDAKTTKRQLTKFLQNELQLELSAEKTLITNAKDRVRFLGYDIKRWNSHKRLRYHTKQGVITKRTCTYQLALLIPKDKGQQFCKKYGTSTNWKAKPRPEMLWQSELEILMTYNAEVRGFLNYYSLADNFTEVGSSILWLSTGSFLRTLASKRQSTNRKVAQSLKQGPNRFVLEVELGGGQVKKYPLISSTKQIQKSRITWNVDQKPNTKLYRARTELGQRLKANQCEWCGTGKGHMEVHHVRKLSDLKGKAIWEQHMIARQRKTIVMCRQCHKALHAGKLPPKEIAKRKLESRMQ
jgi:group II intron reverse transcriptase/maturase